MAAPATPPASAAASPFKQRIGFARSADGIRIAHASSGAGYPLVRAAHWLTHIERDWQTPVWRPWLDELSARFALLRYDSRGCGLSDRQTTEFSLDAMVHDLEAVVDEVKLERFALLGISQGGAVSIAYAARHPERVSHLVLLGGYSRGALKRNPTPQQVEQLQAMIKLMELGWGQENPAFLQLFTTLIFPRATNEQRDSFNHLQRLSAAPEQAARLLTAYSEFDASAELARVVCPTLVLHSRGDARSPFEDEGLFIASSIAGARFQPLETTSHVPLDGEPSFHRAIEELVDFLPKLAPQPSGAAAFPELNPRQLQILERMARGDDNAQIAAHLEVSEKTVRNNITVIFDKLAVENRSQAIVRAREAGLGL